MNTQNELVNTDHHHSDKFLFLPPPPSDKSTQNRLSVTPKEFLSLFSHFNPQMIQSNSTNLHKQSPRSFYEQHLLKRHKICEWKLKKVSNDERETQISQEKCPFWIVVEGKNLEGTCTRQSSRIVERIGPRLVKTWSGSEYELIGAPCVSLSIEEEAFSSRFLEHFLKVDGFPDNWKELLIEEFTQCFLRSQKEHSTRKLMPSSLHPAKEASVNEKSFNFQSKMQRTIEKSSRNSFASRLSSTNSNSISKTMPKSTSSSSSSPIETKITRSGRKSIKPLQFWNNVYRKNI